MPTRLRSFLVEVDASEFAVAGVLSQYDSENSRRPVDPSLSPNGAGRAFIFFPTDQELIMVRPNHMSRRRPDYKVDDEPQNFIQLLSHGLLLQHWLQANQYIALRLIDTFSLTGLATSCLADFLLRWMCGFLEYLIRS
ncbi:hypothetical protein BASA60_001698 [Batrachochytrium salamandrivorans]|nr:hypothetical protein BASA60_001698 [Batrachochytrium salamandrivorans]